MRKIAVARPMAHTAPSLDNIWSKLLSVESRLNALIASQPSRVWRVTQQGNFASTTPVAISWEGGQGGDSTGIPVIGGGVYLIRGMLVAAMASPNQNVYTRFAGPAVSNGGIGYQCIEGGTVYTSGIQTATSADCTINMVSSTSGEFKFEGIWQFAASGTLTMTGRISSTTNWAVQGGSYLEVSQVA